MCTENMKFFLIFCLKESFDEILILMLFCVFAVTTFWDRKVSFMIFLLALEIFYFAC